MNTSKRKIISGLVLLFTGIGITIWKGDIPPNLDNLMQILYSAFVLGNAFEHYTNMKINNTNNKKEEGK